MRIALCLFLVVSLGIIRMFTYGPGSEAVNASAPPIPVVVDNSAGPASTIVADVQSAPVAEIDVAYQIPVEERLDALEKRTTAHEEMILKTIEAVADNSSGLLDLSKAVNKLADFQQTTQDVLVKMIKPDNGCACGCPTCTGQPGCGCCEKCSCGRTDQALEGQPPAPVKPPAPPVLSVHNPAPTPVQQPVQSLEKVIVVTSGYGCLPCIQWDNIEKPLAIADGWIVVHEGENGHVGATPNTYHSVPRFRVKIGPEKFCDQQGYMTLSRLRDIERAILETIRSGKK